MHFNDRNDIIQLTPEWKGERFPDGRPKVPSEVLERIRRITLEEAWGYLWSKGYRYQFQGDFKQTNPGKTLVGRAVTTTLVPTRPDLHNYTLNVGQKEEGRHGTYNQWVIDTLVEDDVVGDDLFDKIFQGTYVGGNLSTAIANRTKRGGAVIWGGIRDMEQIVKISELQIMHRGCDPTGIGDVVLTGFNAATRIGNATCLPGDVVMATISGVLFIPPHLAEDVVTRAEKSHIRDVFGFTRLRDGTYSTAQIDTAWTYAMMLDFVDWFAKSPETEGYRHLSWEEELEESKKREENSTDIIL